jgi:hypothetical protein
LTGKIIYGSYRTPDRYFVDGKEVTREQFDAAFPPKDLSEPPAGPHPGCWPLYSDALAVHPKQIREAMKRDRAHGIASEYNPSDGRMILKDRGQRRDVMRSLGIHDNEGGYGD